MLLLIRILRKFNKEFLSALSHTRLPLANRGIFMKNSMGGWNGSLLKKLDGNRDLKNVQKIK